MHMRMPDRLQFALHVDESALTLRCPPTTLLTLVENAVRHGIDPSEEGGRIDIDVERRGERCRHPRQRHRRRTAASRRTVSAPACRRCASACS